MRTITRAPGACVAILWSSSSASAANCSTPLRWACAMSAARLIVLPKAIRCGGDAEPEAEVDLAARGAVELAAQRGDRGDDLGGGVGLDRVVNGRVAEAGIEGPVLGAEHVEIEDHRRTVEVGRADEAILRGRDGADRGVVVEESCGLARKGGSVSHAHLHQSRGLQPRSSQKRRYRRYVSSPRWGTLQRRVRWRRKGAYEASARRNQAKTDRPSPFSQRGAALAAEALKLR